MLKVKIYKTLKGFNRFICKKYPKVFDPKGPLIINANNDITPKRLNLFKAFLLSYIKYHANYYHHPASSITIIIITITISITSHHDRHYHHDYCN